MKEISASTAAASSTSCSGVRGYEPAGVLMFWSARIAYLDHRRPCDLWIERDVPMLERLVQHLNALADGAFV